MSIENLEMYKKYLDQLHQIELDGGNEKEEERICNLMDDPGNGMSSDEIKEANQYSAKLWEEYDKMMAERK